MQTAQLSDYQPLISIIVPMIDDAEDSATRIALGSAQTWHNLEVIAVQAHAASDFALALNAGLSASKGDFFSLLLPGASYTPDKIARQIAFVAQFDLQDAVVLCNYTVVDSINAGGAPIILPSFDPVTMFRKIYCGLPIDYSTLLFPRTVMLELGLLDEQAGQAILQGFFPTLSQKMTLVGMAASLVSVVRRPKFTVVEKSYLRKLYAGFLPEMLRQSGAYTYDSNLGEAAVVRLAQGLPLAAWNALCATWKLFGQHKNAWRALQTFQCINLISGPLPVADVVFCRDCLGHLPYEDVLAAIETIRESKCRWLLATTFTRAMSNTNLDAAGWCALNLTLPPFNFPPPTLMISEKCTEAGSSAGDKSLRLWQIADLQPRKRV